MIVGEPTHGRAPRRSDSGEHRHRALQKKHDEVDLVVDRDDGAILAFEVKASGLMATDGFRGLRRLRDACGDAFVAGVGLYLGRDSSSVDGRLFAMPVDRLWAVAG